MKLVRPHHLRTFRPGVLAGLTLTVLAGCGIQPIEPNVASIATSTPPAPTSTAPVVPTNKAITATSTATPSPIRSISPTATPTELPTATAIATSLTGGVEIEQTVRDAIDRTIDARVYQMSHTLNEMTRWSLDQQLIWRGDMYGSVNGDDMYTFVQERYDDVIESGTEYMRVDGTAYTRRVSGGYIDSGQWHKDTDERNVASLRMHEATMWLSVYTNDASFAGLDRVESVTQDGRSCQRYSGRGDVALNAMAATNTSLLQSDDLTPEGREKLAIDEANIHITICDDGYVHTYAIDVAGQRRAQDETVFATNFELRLWDFDKPVALTAPADAIENTDEAAGP